MVIFSVANYNKTKLSLATIFYVSISKSVIILKFWEDDEEIRIGGRAGMVPPQEESEDGDRVSFPRWGKRNVVSFHFTELVLEITVLKMLPFFIERWTKRRC